MKDKKIARNNRETIAQLGDLTESLYLEVAPLPLSDVAKNALVMSMLGEITQQNGNQITITFDVPAKQSGHPRQPCAQP